MGRILLLSDDPAIIDQVRFPLQRQGHAVETAPNAVASLSGIDAAAPPDLVIIDGERIKNAIIDAIRTDASLKGLVLLLLTRCGDEATNARYFAEMYLSKPFQANELCAFVRRILTYNPSEEHARSSGYPLEMEINRERHSGPENPQ